MNIVIGMGEIGRPWFNLVSQVKKALGIDLDSEKCIGKWSGEQIEILHVSIPYNKSFVNTMIDYALKFKPKMIVVHSTVKPFTTKELHEDKRLRKIKIIYSAVRGVHARMESDLKKYDKFYSSYQDDCS